MPDHEDQRVVVGWGLLLGWVILVIAMVVMVVAATFFATGLRDGFIETGGSAAGLGAMLVALVIGVSGLIVVGGVTALRRTRIARPRLHLGLILAVPLVWMTTTMAVSWQYVGAVSAGDPDVEYDAEDDPWADPENKFSDTSGVVLLLGSCGMLPLVGLAIPHVIVLLRKGAPGIDANDASSAIEGD